jgi:hypothetical protein
MRGIGRRIRSSFGLGSSRVSIRPQVAWYWRWLTNLGAMAIVAGVVWWVVQNSNRITGFNADEARQQIDTLGEENRRMKSELETTRASLSERDRQLQIEKASQSALARSVAQLQDENGRLKEDLGFLQRLMSSGQTPEGIGVSDLKVEREGSSAEYRYRMLLTQGGQRKQDFRGRVQIQARIARGPDNSTLTFPDPALPESTGSFEFRFYHKVEGRFRIPEGAALKGVEVRVLAVPGGQVKLSRTINFP